MFRIISLLVLGVAASFAAAAEPRQFDAVVYGGTPAGLAAACALADEGRSVALVEPYSFVGGLVTNGLSHADFRSLEALTGFWWDFTRRVEDHYRKTYGPDSEEVKSSFKGNQGEPKVNLMVFQQMLAERKNITVFLKHALENVASTRSMPSAILSLSCRPEGKGEPVVLQAKVYVDASYEGDLMAGAGVAFAVGREDQAAYGESLAATVPKGGDGQVQGYNFRWCMTQAPENKVRPSKPDGYRREDFVDVLPLFEKGTLIQVFGVQHANGMLLPEALGKETTKAIYKVQPPLLANGKTDINDMSRGSVRLSMPDINDGYPNASREERKRIVQQHVTYQLGLLYFLQNDDAVPAKIKADANGWGFCKDEWPEHGHLPEQLYVREARRMIGEHVFTRDDTVLNNDDVRVPLKKEGIAIGDYSHNCHGTGREGTRFNGKHTGEFYERTAPFQIVYGTLVPKTVTNLLVPVAVSASHVGFGALRLEPTWSGMGQAAGLAAHLSMEKKIGGVQGVSVDALQALLHKHRAATIYVSDVAPDSPDFQAVQWLGMLGGFHGMHQPENGEHTAGKKLFGQYAHAYPMHEAGLERPVDEATLTRWISLLPEAGRAKAETAGLKADEKLTRGEVMRTLHGMR